MDETDDILNLGCGFAHMVNAVNVDKYDNCKPDVVWDLNKTPYPWNTGRFEEVRAYHVLEHLENWFSAFQEMARVTKIGGKLRIAVPHISNDGAMAYRDHHRVFTECTFFGVKGYVRGMNAWAGTEQDTIPLVLRAEYLTPMNKYQWMAKVCPRVLRFCADHLRNYIHESVFEFERVSDDYTYR